MEKEVQQPGASEVRIAIQSEVQCNQSFQASCLLVLTVKASALGQSLLGSLNYGSERKRNVPKHFNTPGVGMGSNYLA